jgi:hypothetical protein
MKRLTIILFAMVLLFAFSSMASAQGLTGYGLKAGLNMASFGGDNGDADFWEVELDKKMKMGFTAGGFVTYSITEMFAVQPEVFYTMKGVKYEGDDWTTTFTYNYLEIPVLAKFTIPTEGNISPNLFVGPALGINLSAKYKEEYDGQTEEGDVEDYPFEFGGWPKAKSTDFGLVFGAGVDIGMPHSAITIDGRYTLGLTSNSEDYEWEYDGEVIETCECDITNSVISFTVGYSF